MSAPPGSANAASTAPRPRRGELLELEVSTLAFGGAGVARKDGYVVFVAGALPGERVRAEVGQAKRTWAQARAVEILRPSPERQEPLAPHPGAPWQILPYERQLEVKSQQVDDALRRLGRLEGFELEPILAAEQPWRYRNKLEYSFGTGPGGELICGFHAPGEWERIVAVKDCLLASRASNELRDSVLEHLRASAVRAQDRRSGEGFLRNLVVREGRRTGELQVRLVTAGDGGGGDSRGREGDLRRSSGEGFDREAFAAALGDRAAVLWTVLDSPAEVTRGGHTELLSGAQRIQERLCGLSFAISPEAFFQTNTEMAERLCEVVLDHAQLSGFERVYDLYCGIGTIALVLAPRAARVYGLELSEQAVADARANAAANEIDNARFVAGDVRLALRELTADAGRPDLIVLDPPRAGLSAKVVRRVIEAAPRRIVYVSCNPTTLAPNAAQLVAAGYRLARVRPVDMFPQTPHIECVAELVRSAP